MYKAKDAFSHRYLAFDIDGKSRKNKGIRSQYERDRMIPAKALKPKSLCIKCIKNEVFPGHNAGPEEKICSECK